MSNKIKIKTVEVNRSPDEVVQTLTTFLYDETYGLSEKAIMDRSITCKDIKECMEAMMFYFTMANDQLKNIKLPVSYSYGVKVEDSEDAKN